MAKKPKNYEQLKKAREKTQFKKGHKPKERPGYEHENKPWDVRRELRYVAAQKVQLGNEKVLARMMKGQSVARQGALTLWHAAIATQDPNTMNHAIEHTCGKQIQPTMDLPPYQPAKEEFTSVEEAAATYADIIRRF